MRPAPLQLLRGEAGFGSSFATAVSAKHLIQSRPFKGTALIDSNEMIDRKEEDQSVSQADDQRVQADTSMRPVWIILFAAILILICTKSKADEQHVAPITVADGSVTAGSVTQVASSVSHATLTIELNGEVHVIKPSPKPAAANRLSVGAAVSNDAGVRQASWAPGLVARPAYAQLTAHLANFDADADPDGWRAEVILFDRDDRPVAVRGQANFQLTPRLPTGDFHHYVDAETKPIRWSENLSFDADAVARFKLPLRSPLRSSWGWSADNYSETLSRHSGSRWRSSIPRFGSFRTNHARFVGTAVARDIRSSIGRPDFGELRVRVSVAGEGVFDAVCVVPIRPAVLVDTHWPYR